jgi:hypothetical protein
VEFRSLASEDAHPVRGADCPDRGIVSGRTLATRWQLARALLRARTRGRAQAAAGSARVASIAARWASK